MLLTVVASSSSRSSTFMSDKRRFIFLEKSLSSVSKVDRVLWLDFLVCYTSRKGKVVEMAQVLNVYPLEEES